MENYLAELRRKTRPGEPILKEFAANADENRLTFEMVNLARALAHFGFYDFEELLGLVQSLLAIIDTRPFQPNNGDDEVNSQKPRAHQKLIRQFTTRLGANNKSASPIPIPNSLALSTKSTPKRQAMKESETAEEAANSKQSREMLLQTKLIAAELLDFAMDVRRDFRITVALSFFKEHFPCNENGELPNPPGQAKK